MKIVAFGASNSKNSINKKWASYALSFFESADGVVLDLNDFPLPIYSMDLEQESGVPENAVAFYNHLQGADLIIISLAEHNGSYSAAFKNLFDWMSRHEGSTFANKKMLLLATSPGARGGQGVLEAAFDRFPRHGAQIVGSFSLPSFYDNFSDEGLINNELSDSFISLIEKVKSEL